MKNIFKAMIYRMSKSRILVYSIICSVVFPLALSLIGIFSENREQGIYGTWDNFFFMGNLIYLVFVCAYNCSDYKNKTINFEIMNGHSSAEVFMGRALALLAVAEIMFNIGMVITHLVLSNSTAYSSIVENNEMYVLRIVSIEMVFLAYIVFYVFMSFVARNTIIALVMSWIGFAIGGLVVFFDNKIILPRVKKNQCSYWTKYSKIYHAG